MKQLSGRASSFLNFETPTALAHTGSVSLFEPLPDGSPLDADRVRDLFAERIAELPQYRTKLLQVPLGLDRPYWIDDPDFDLEFHIRSMAVPAPGEMGQLEALIGRLHARPIDRSRPLWEVYIIDGLADGRVAWYTKTHHACLDSYTGAEIMNALLDREPEGREPLASQWTPERVPGTAEMLGRGVAALAGRPRAMLRLQRRLVTSAFRQVSSQIPPLLETVAETLDRTSGLVGSRLGKRLASDDYLSRPPLVAPRLSFNRSVSAHRRVAFGSFPLDDLRAIKKWSERDNSGTTINDVVIAICSGGLRTWLARRDEAPGDPLLALIPVQVAASAESPAAKASGGERASVGELAAMIAALPTNEPDPAERLRMSHQAMKIAKDDHAAVPAELMADLGDFAPPIIAAGAAQIVSRLGVADMANPRFNVVISNIPGPQRPRYAAGHLQVAAFPVPVITDGAGLNITVLSYAGQMHVGLVADRTAVDDLDLLVTDIGDALAELVQLTH